RPYNPGSLVVTFTTTSRMPAGAVKIAFTSVIFSGPWPLAAVCEAVAGCCDWAVWFTANSGSAAPPAKEICVNHLRRSIINPFVRQRPSDGRTRDSTEDRISVFHPCFIRGFPISSDRRPNHDTDLSTE